VYRVLRNTAYDDCVAYPFGSDGEDDGYLTEGEGLDLLRKKTPGILKAMEIFPEEIEAVKAGKGSTGSKRSTLRELRNTSLNEKQIK